MRCISRHLPLLGVALVGVGVGVGGGKEGKGCRSKLGGHTQSTDCASRQVDQWVGGVRALSVSRPAAAVGGCATSVGRPSTPSVDGQSPLIDRDLGLSEQLSEKPVPHPSRARLGSPMRIRRRRGHEGRLTTGCRLECGYTRPGNHLKERVSERAVQGQLDKRLLRSGIGQYPWLETESDEHMVTLRGRFRTARAQRQLLRCLPR